MTLPAPDWQTPDGSAKLFLGDCLSLLPLIEAGSVDAVVTDPPYLTSNQTVPIRGRGVAERIIASTSVGMPWGYNLDWVAPCRDIRLDHWIVFCNYRMLGAVCTTLEPSAVFVWRKSNAPRMTRPVPRLDCEYIVWHRRAGCARMGEFNSLVLDVPMPQAGCFATERVLMADGKSAAHPCQKPVAIVYPFVDRLDAQMVLDPFMGSGTTGVACMKLGRRFIGMEIDPGYFKIACDRIQQAYEERQMDMFKDEPPPPQQDDMIAMMDAHESEG